MSTQNKPELDLVKLELEAIRRSLTLTNLSPAEMRELWERLDRLQGQLAIRETKDNGKAAARDHLIFFPAPTRRIVQEPPKARRRRRGQMPRLARVVGTVHSVLNVMLQVLFLAFLVLFGLQFPHPPKWDNWWWVVGLQRFMEPLLTELDKTLEWPEATVYYPLALAVLMQAGRMVLNLNLPPLQQKLQRMPARARRSRALA